MGRQGVWTDPLKVSAVEGWPVPRTVAELRSFLGLCTYYKKFVQGFATIATPLYQLTRKGAFVALKQALVEAPVSNPERNYTQMPVRKALAQLMKGSPPPLSIWGAVYHLYRPCCPEMVKDFERARSRRPVGKMAWKLLVSESIAEDDERWREDQRTDQDLAPVIRWLETGKKRPQWEAVSPESPATKYLVDQWKALHLENGVLQRRWVDAATGKQQWLVVAPLSCREGLLKEVHNRKISGHLGVKRTMEKLWCHVYWVGLPQDFQEWCRTCQVCAAKKGPAQKTRATSSCTRPGH
ncbi:hypothetical protein C7M84_017595 [Penaeus vannamei]|uniref:RNA-directed DNA polymerase n=1 Tax=Penaeus vannamei TaxID=6689 RepID=A0A423SJS5_PENVA|nr:hypothetical protein C7M84_017595 [Penaeus vannamei]